MDIKVIVISFFASLVLMGLAFLSIWWISSTGIFFKKIKEGQGILVKKGETFNKAMIAYAGHHIEAFPEKTSVVREGITYEQVGERWEVFQGAPTHSGLLGVLEKEFGIYYVGIYPFSQIMKYQFRWNEWETKTNLDGKTSYHLRRREEETEFFYVQTFAYALFLEGAETGGQKGADEGGNVSVDIRITLLIRIICPQVAILQNENWYDQLASVAIDHARIYVGEHSFNDLRANEMSEEEDKKDSKGLHAFSQHMLGLNKQAPVGEPKDGLEKVFGVKIIGAQILTVDLSEESKRLAAITTARYEAEEKAAVMKIDANAIAEKIRIEAEANADAIRKTGQAEADAVSMRIAAVEKHGETGKYVLRQEALGEAGKGGNIIVFTGENEGETSKLLSQLLAAQKAQ